MGDCIVVELERLMTELRCTATDDLKRDALRYAVHFVGDIHQPLHTVGEGRGGNDIAVEVRFAGAKTCRGEPRPIMSYRSNFHGVWDGTLIKTTTWSWGAYVDRLEGGWLASPEARAVDGGTPAQWAEETHQAARGVWEKLPASRWSTMPTTARSCRRSTGNSASRDCGWRSSSMTCRRQGSARLVECVGRRHGRQPG